MKKVNLFTERKKDIRNILGGKAPNLEEKKK